MAIRTFFSLLSVALLMTCSLGCGASSGTSEVEPEPEQTQAEMDAYEAEMDKPSDMGG